MFNSKWPVHSGKASGTKPRATAGSATLSVDEENDNNNNSGNNGKSLETERLLPHVTSYNSIDTRSRLRTSIADRIQDRAFDNGTLKILEHTEATDPFAEMTSVGEPDVCDDEVGRESTNGKSAALPSTPVPTSLPDQSNSNHDRREDEIDVHNGTSKHPPGSPSPPNPPMQQQQQHNDIFLGSWMREWRHSPCLMQPVSLTMFFIFGLFMVVTLLLQLPGLILGLILSPILQRSTWYIEFLYPLPIGRWAHFLLMKATASRRQKKRDDKNRGFHSRTVEQKIEVVPDRIYIHPIPQFLDNVGYLIVCIPEPSIERTENNTIIRVESMSDPIVALMIDCGDCPEVIRAIELISEYHYNNRTIQIQSIASTHKHHDHTGGNAELLEHETVGKSITRVYGGAVERVPRCTDQLVDGQKLVLPHFQTNDMNELIEIEAVGVPAHTRGSLVYRLRSKRTNHYGQRGSDPYTPGVEYMFTGDTMFSGGSGVAFESDIGSDSEKKIAKSNGNTFVRGNQGTTAMERCFSEVIARAMPRDDSPDVCSRIILFPGHEYTQDLLLRQFQHNSIEQGRWKNLPPRDFFETVSNLYTALHRRSLPQNSGRLMTIPTTLKREVMVNTVCRSLRRSAELVVRAVVFWYDHFCKEKIGNIQYHANSNNETSHSGHYGATKSQGKKTPSTIKRWNIDSDDINRDVFTTIYTADLQSLIDDLASGKLSQETASQQLQLLATRRMDIPTVNKRAIPGFMPSDKNIYRGICGLTMLGSRPCAMTISDSQKMNLSPPESYNSDKILVSQKRLTLVLRRLGMIQSPSGDDVSLMIHQLWKEANQIYSQPDDHTRQSSDPESMHSSSTWHDEVDLGVLKWLMYGVPANQPSWMSQNFCSPCSNVSDYRYVFPDHPATKMNKKSGELVSHDVLTCLLCRDATGNIQLTDDGDDITRTNDCADRTMTERPSPPATTTSSSGSNRNLASQPSHARSSLREAETDDSWNDQGVIQEWEADIAETIVKQTSQTALG